MFMRILNISLTKMYVNKVIYYSGTLSQVVIAKKRSTKEKSEMLN